jgi:hypothetical protein
MSDSDIIDHAPATCHRIPRKDSSGAAAYLLCHELRVLPAGKHLER